MIEMHQQNARIKTCVRMIWHVLNCWCCDMCSVIRWMKEPQHNRTSLSKHVLARLRHTLE